LSCSRQAARQCVIVEGSSGTRTPGGPTLASLAMGGQAVTLANGDRHGVVQDELLQACHVSTAHASTPARTRQHCTRQHASTDTSALHTSARQHASMHTPIACTLLKKKKKREAGLVVPEGGGE